MHRRPSRSVRRDPRRTARLAGGAWPVALLYAACGSGAWDVDGGDRPALGRRFVEARGCPTCHQSSSEGEGILAGQSEPRPGTQAFGANLTPDVDSGLGGWADVQIVRALRHGVDPDGLPLCPPMPRYGGGDAAAEAFMSDLEAGLIVDYLRSLPAVATPGGKRESLCPPLKEPRVDMAVPDDAEPDHD